MSGDTCTIGDCERPAEARGMCAPHYLRWWRRQRGVSKPATRFPMHVPVGDTNPRRIPPEKQDRIRELLGRRRSLAWIAREAGTSVPTVKRYARMFEEEEDGCRGRRTG